MSKLWCCEIVVTGNGFYQIRATVHIQSTLLCSVDTTLYLYIPPYGESNGLHSSQVPTTLECFLFLSVYNIWKELPLDLTCSICLKFLNTSMINL